MTGIKLYQGVIPKSGNQVFSFSGIKLVHRSIKDDKSDYIVHQETGAVMLAMPLKSERSIALNFLAKNIDRLLHFNTKPESYELYILDKVVKVTKKEAQEANTVVYNMEREPSYSDRGCVSKPKIKKTFDVRYAKW